MRPVLSEAVLIPKQDLIAEDNVPLRLVPLQEIEAKLSLESVSYFDNVALCSLIDMHRIDGRGITLSETRCWRGMGS